MNRIVIDPSRKKFNLGIKELRAYYDLFYVLAYRDIKVRYAQTFLGFFWAILQPLSTLVVFILVFGVAVKVDTGSIPYPLFAISGIALWSYFSFVLSQSGQSIIGAQEMIKKIYFPRIIIPLSKGIVGLVDFSISLIMLVVLSFIYKPEISHTVIFAPLIILLNIVASLGVGIWLSSLTIRFRDFQHVVPFLVQVGMYATPVAYPARLIPSKYLWLYNLNPMAGLIEGFRWSVFGGTFPSHHIWISVAMVLVLFVSGIVYFKKVEDTIADLV